MHHSCLTDLPPTPSRTGWPWTVESPQLPESMPDGSFWPRVSIVTPSYNQGHFIEETIRSVLLQGYPNLEYIVMDGGSTDSSVELIRDYEPWLAHWVSEPDEGQVHAIAEGWSRCTGSIVAYLNSDDTYLPGAVASAVRHLLLHPTAAAVCGGELTIDREGHVLSERLLEAATFRDLTEFRFIPQPAVFLRRSALKAAGGLNPSFQLVFDFELWTRLVQQGEIYCVPEVFATTRWYPETKTLSQRPKVISELEQVLEKILASPEGAQLTQEEKRLSRARLSYTAVDVYLDSPVTRAWPLLRSIASVLKNWPPLAPELMRMVVWRKLPSSVRRLASACKRRIFGQAPVRREDSPRIHWSDWTSNLPSSDIGAY